jgi:hypothetical protein
VFPLVFASSAFVSVANMPGWLQAFAKANPILRSLAWIAAILLVFVPLAVSRYRRAAG